MDKISRLKCKGQKYPTNFLKLERLKWIFFLKACKWFWNEKLQKMPSKKKSDFIFIKICPKASIWKKAEKKCEIQNVMLQCERFLCWPK